MEIGNKNKQRSGFINLVFKRLQQLLKAAYCKYSNYPVACLIETNDGWYAGVNVENGSFGLTICAERILLLMWLQIKHNLSKGFTANNQRRWKMVHRVELVAKWWQNSLKNKFQLLFLTL